MELSRDLRSIVFGQIPDDKANHLLGIADHASRISFLLGLKTEPAAFLYARALTGSLSRQGSDMGIRTPVPENNRILTEFLDICDLANPADDPMELSFSDQRTMVGDEAILFPRDPSPEAAAAEEEEAREIASVRGYNEFVWGATPVPVGVFFQDRLKELAKMAVDFPSQRMHNLVRAIMPWWSVFFMDSEEIDEKIKPSIITYCHMADEATYKAETDALEREAEAISKLDPEIIENQRKLVEFLTKVKAIQSRQTLEKAQAALKIPDKLKEVYQNNANVLLELCYPLLNIFDVYKLTI